MNCLDILTENMAEVNIDVAVDGLKNLLKNSIKKSNKDTKKYASKLSRYTQYIHMNVWSNSVPVERVKEELIPLLEKAHKKIIWKGEYYEDLRTFIECRIGNLHYNYLNGLASRFPVDRLERYVAKSSTV